MGARFLGEAIQSVLDQTYADFEVIVVDDCSPDHTAQVMDQFRDPRVRYLVHEVNKGADVARHTGLQSSSGEIIVLLDQDDLFHPEKLEQHVSFLEKHPDIGFTYNARFELNYSKTTIRDLWRPPREITLADLFLWFPLSPSDVVLRRKWALEMDLLSGTRGAEILHFSRLHLSGCKFGYVDRALNYRRYHSGRSNTNLLGSCRSELNNQEIVFSDPRCPAEVKALRDMGHANIYLYWAYQAFSQGETSLGQEFIRNAIQYKPFLLEGTPSELMNFLVINGIDDENLDHAAQLEKVFAQFPPELDWLSQQCEWAIARGYFLKGARAMMWDQHEDGQRFFEEAIRLGSQVDELLISQLTSKLLDYNAEFGEEAAKSVLAAWMPFVEMCGGRARARRLNGSYAANRAFQDYSKGEFNGIPGIVIHAVANDPRYLINRGLLSVLLRSTVSPRAKLS
jgi:glycosyltransferase involved in cell wall biosynthesis